MKILNITSHGHRFFSREKAQKAIIFLNQKTEVKFYEKYNITTESSHFSFDLRLTYFHIKVKFFCLSYYTLCVYNSKEKLPQKVMIFMKHKKQK